MKFIGNSAQIEGGAIYVKAPSVAIDFNISPIFNTGCFIQYEVNTEPFSLEPQDWNVIDDNQPFYLRSSNFSPLLYCAGGCLICQQHSWQRWCCNLCHEHWPLYLPTIIQYNKLQHVNSFNFWRLTTFHIHVIPFTFFKIWWPICWLISLRVFIYVIATTVFWWH